MWLAGSVCPLSLLACLHAGAIFLGEHAASRYGGSKVFRSFFWLCLSVLIHGTLGEASTHNKVYNGIFTCKLTQMLQATFTTTPLTLIPSTPDAVLQPFARMDCSVGGLDWDLNPSHA